MLLLKTSLGWLCLAAVRANLHCESHVVEDTEDTFNGFLQVNMETHAEIVHATSHGDVPKMWPLLEIKIDPKRQVSYQPETVTPLLHFFSQFSKAVVMVLYFFLLMSVIVWLLRGLPTKTPQDESVKDGCPTTWLLFLCSTYGFIFFTTDQYAPSLPQMGVDLSGSQGVMSATVQLNFVVKSVTGLVTAGISDHVGRRPVMVTCLSLLAFATFACGCAPNINWFLASRFLQGLGESLEPVIYAACRDYFSKPEERIVVISLIQIIAIAGQIVAPIFGGFSSVLFNWRFSFFCLALIWGAFAAYAAIYMVESCPDNGDAEKQGTFRSDLRRILVPGSLCILLAEMSVIVPFEVFSANIGYVSQVSYGQSSVGTAVILLVWAVLDALGVILMQSLQSACALSILQTGRWVIVAVVFTGALSMVLGNFAEYLWSYTIACSFQSLFLAAALVPMNVLYFEPLEDCAGLAASIEILFKYVPPCLYSMICTQSLIHSGVQSYMNLQSVSYMACPLFYLGYEAFRLQPMATSEAIAGKDPDKELVLTG